MAEPQHALTLRFWP